MATVAFAGGWHGGLAVPKAVGRLIGPARRLIASHGGLMHGEGIDEARLPAPV